MRIYNEITSIFNEITGKWDTISEDSFEWNGPVMLAQYPWQTALSVSDTDGAPDKIIDTIKTTAGYFTNGDGTLEGFNTYTGSLADSNEKYYFNVVQTHPGSSSAVTQFSVGYGHINGSGSDCKGGTANPSTLKGETEAIYEQYTSLLLASNEITGGFQISQQGTNGVKTSGQADDDIFVLVGKRARMKDRINKKAWTISLKGYSSAGGASAPLLRHFTDDSVSVASTTTPAGPRYNIVSGSIGNVSGTGAIADKTYGWFYPDMGIMVFSAAELSASIPGPAGTQNLTASFVQTPLAGTANAFSSSGFAVNTNNNADCKNALRFVNCLRNVGSSVAARFRSEEDQTQVNYFCRVKAGDYNFSNNPTFVSGSDNKIRHTNMRGNPTTYITGVGLYDDLNRLVAVAKLSSPLKKNYSSEASIKVKLTY